MKRCLLLLAGFAIAAPASAQLGSLSLSGTSYSQDFDGLAGGLPQGWHVWTAAKSDMLGYLRDTSVKLILTPSNSLSQGTRWTSTNGGFKNYASADNSTTFTPFSADSAGNINATDRALGVRQVGYTNANFGKSDSGAAFSLKLDNTTGLSSFVATFKLQSLDSTSRRRTIWVVDYGIGDLPTSFTMVSTAGFTGAYTYGSNTVTVDFGNMLDNQAGPVWIRVAALKPSDTLLADGSGPSPSGTSTRASSAIDDFTLSYSNTGGNTCNAATGLTASGISPTGAILSWDAVSGADGYYYLVDQNAADPSSSSGALITTTSTSESGLNPSTTYYLHVKTRCVSGETSAWTTQSFTTTSLSVGTVSAQHMPLAVIGQPNGSEVKLAFTLKQAGTVNIEVMDATGRRVATETFAGLAGAQQRGLMLNLPAGLYTIRAMSGKQTAVVKTVVQ